MRAGFAAVARSSRQRWCAGCSQHGSTQNENAAATVVASTDVWGSVASAVAGDHATVTSILDSAVDDPHSYEATPANAAAIADASLVVFNGGDYDHWVDDVLANDPDVPTVDAYSLRPDPQQPANEHVFYDPATAKAVAAQVADQLAQIDSSHADTYRANAAAFARNADEVLTLERTIGQEHPGASGGGDRTRRALPVGQRRHHRQDPGGFRERDRGRHRPVACRPGRHARPDQHPPGVRAGVQPADRDRGHRSSFGTPQARPRYL